MNAAARRNSARRGWPRGLYEPRPGYYVWRHPTTGETLPIGRITLAAAKSEAIAANLLVEGMRPSLVDRVSGATQTISDLLGKMPAATAVNTMKARKSLDKAIGEALGAKRCSDLTVADCATFLEAVEESGRARLAQALRSRLMAVCKRGMQLGWMDANPVDPTRQASPEVKRGRLTLESYRAIRAKADEVAEWLGLAMDLALCTGADRVTVAGLTRANVDGEWLEYQRSKTGIKLRVPLSLELRAAGLVLADLVRSRTGVASRLLVHHVRPWGNAPVGSKVHPDRISHTFTEARKLAGIPDEGAPTFHEIRSLAKRLYEAQGNVDTQWLLGHRDKRTATLYANPRGAEVVLVKVTPLPRSEHEVNTK